MTPFIFPTAVAVCMFGSWVVLISLEACAPQHTNQKLDCWSSMRLIATLACIGSALTGLIALFARIALYSFLPFEIRKRESISDLLASTILVFLYNVIPWEYGFGKIGSQLLSWLVITFVICGMLLIIVKNLTVDSRSS